MGYGQGQVEEEGDSEWEWLVGNKEEAFRWVEKEFNQALEYGSQDVKMTVFADNFQDQPDCTVDYYFQVRV